MKEYSAIQIKDSGPIRIIFINRPESLNALNSSVFDELERAIDEIESDSLIRGVIISGSGDKAFVAGADIKEFTGMGEEQAQILSRRGQNLFSRIENFHIPVIAAVNGFALGGGCELAMSCHMRVAGANARFGQPELKLGILPGYGGTQRLVHLVGKAKALEIILTADMISAEEALRIGLVNCVCDKGDEINTSLSILDKVINMAPLAVRESIAAVNAALEPDTDGYEKEIVSFGKLAQTTDFKEGVEAFLEKRKAIFKGK